jgi:hypothetical protein
MENIITSMVDPEENTGLFEVVRDHQKNLEFKGKLLCHVHTDPDYGPWSEASVYQTRGGKYVGEKNYDEQNESKNGRGVHHEAIVCSDLEDLVDFFGYDQLAKAVYKDLGLDTAEIID